MTAPWRDTQPESVRAAVWTRERPNGTRYLATWVELGARRHRTFDSLASARQYLLDRGFELTTPHNRGSHPIPPVERFWTKVERTESCWLWTAAKYVDGYGTFRVEGSNVRAHRFAYELLVGPIPDGLEIDHLCRVRRCVNPAHMEPVTHYENTQRMVIPKRETCRRAGHPYAEHGKKYQGKWTCMTCHRERMRANYAARKAVSS